MLNTMIENEMTSFGNISIQSNYQFMLFTEFIAETAQALATYALQFRFFFNWDSFYTRLNSHYEAWSYKKKKHKKVKA